MKKLLFTLFTLVLLAPATLASDFSYGQTEKGSYYFSESKQIVYSRDASCIMDTINENVMCSTLKYAHRMTMPASYYNRIHAMSLLVK